MLRVPATLAAGYYVFENWRRLYTKGVKSASTAEIPPHLRRTVFSLFIKCFGVNAEEILEPLESFATFQHFFIRQVRPRELARRPGELYAPCDASVTEIRRVEDDSSIELKSVVYSLKKLFTGEEGAFTREEIRRDLRADEDLFAVSFYLAPRDYHRFHAPDDLRVHSLSYIPGALLSVNPFRKRIKVQLDGNERVVLDAQGRLGRVKMVFVAALGVGGIEVLDFRNSSAAAAEGRARREVRAGEELGMFLLGSSILMLFAVPKGFRFAVAEGEAVRYGQPLGRCG